MRQIAFQLFTARSFGSVPELVGQLAGYGYDAVEGYSGIYDEPRKLADLLARHGIAMPSGHFDLADLEKVDEVCGIAAELGIASVICPNIELGDRPQNNGDWIALARRVNRLAEGYRASGLRFAWHNNDFEFLKTPEGDLPMRLLLEETEAMDWQFDVPWAIKGGSDPLPWFDRYDTRIFSLHVKDFAERPSATQPEGWCTIGHGLVDWPAIVARYERSCPQPLLVAEHEALEDLREFATKSLTNMRNW